MWGHTMLSVKLVNLTASVIRLVDSSNSDNVIMELPACATPVILDRTTLTNVVATQGYNITDVVYQVNNLPTQMVPDLYYIVEQDVMDLLRRDDLITPCDTVAYLFPVDGVKPIIREITKFTRKYISDYHMYRVPFASNEPIIELCRAVANILPQVKSSDPRYSPEVERVRQLAYQLWTVICKDINTPKEQGDVLNAHQVRQPY
jgi:hypothetical protein